MTEVTELALQVEATADMVVAERVVVQAELKGHTRCMVWRSRRSDGRNDSLCRSMHRPKARLHRTVARPVTGTLRLHQ